MRSASARYTEQAKLMNEQHENSMQGYLQAINDLLHHRSNQVKVAVGIDILFFFGWEVRQSVSGYTPVCHRE